MSGDYDSRYYDHLLDAWETSRFCNYEFNFALAKAKAYVSVSSLPISVLDIGGGGDCEAYSSQVFS